MKSSPFFPWIVWGVGATFFLFGFFARVAPSVMVEELMRDFGVGAAVLGNLSAFYFYAYAGLQVPLGVMMDRWPERVLTAGMTVCGLGFLLFAMATDLSMAYAGRFLIGAGAATAWLGTLKLVSVWFPTNKFARMNGLTAMFGMAGAVGAQAPLAMVIEAAGWRGAMMSGAGFLVMLAIVAWFFLRQSAASGLTAGGETAGVFRHLAGVARTPQTWYSALVISTQSFPLLVFAGLWGVPYLMAMHGLERPVAAVSTSLYLIGWGIGAPLIGGLSDRFGRRRAPMLIGTFAAFGALLLLIYVPGLPLLAVQGLLFFSGFAGSTGLIAYAVARENNSSESAGAMAGTMNMMTMTMGALGQPLIGWLLDLEWDGRMEAGARLYSPEAYHEAFLVLAAAGALCLVGALLTRETHCRPVAAH